MIYSIRLWLATWFFKLGKNVHPDIARLKREIMEAKRQMDHMPSMFVRDSQEQSGND